MKTCILIVVVTLTLTNRQNLIAETYYASPTGGGDGRSMNSPFKVGDFWSIAKPGDTLLLLDGKYTGSYSMLTPPEGLSGASGSPITVKALNDGQAEIDGQFSAKPVYLLRTNYITLEGFNVHSSLANYDVVEIDRANNTILRRIIAWDAPATGNREVFSCNYGSDNLFEDCAGWGSGRKIFGLFSDTRTTFRRCFFRWTYHTDTVSFWKVGMSLGYYSIETLVENCIGTWDELPGTYSPQRYAIFGTDNYGTGLHRLIGSIGYHLSTQGGSPNNIFGTINFKPSYEIKDCVGFADNNDPVIPFALDSQTSFKASHLTAIGGNGNYGIWGGNNISGTINHSYVQNAGKYGSNVGDRFDYILYSNNAHDYESAPNTYEIDNTISLTSNGGNILQYGIDEAQRPKVNNQSVGAQIQNRYVNGVLTNEPLWPWPMNDRIQAAMVQSGYHKKGGLDGNGGTDLTKIIFELGHGTMPSEWDSNPTPSFGISLTADQTSGSAPLTVNFQGNALNGTPPYNFSWDFGDGNRSTKQNPTHTFQSARSYVVQLTVRDSDNNTKKQTLSITVNSGSEPSQNSITALKTVSQITIDGNLSESSWNEAKFETFSNINRSDNEVTVYALWDSDSLYFACKVTDSNLEALNQFLWEDDGMEIYLDSENNKSVQLDSNDYHFTININDQTEPTNILAKTTFGQGGYTMEIAIPWTLMNTTPQRDNSLGLLLGNNDRDIGTFNQFDWLNLIESGSYARPNLWGDLILSSQQVGQEDDTKPPASPTGLKATLMAD